MISQYKNAERPNFTNLTLHLVEGRRLTEWEIASERTRSAGATRNNCSRKNGKENAARNAAPYRSVAKAATQNESPVAFLRQFGQIKKRLSQVRSYVRLIRTKRICNGGKGFTFLLTKCLMFDLGLPMIRMFNQAGKNNRATAQATRMDTKTE